MCEVLNMVTCSRNITTLIVGVVSDLKMDGNFKIWLLYVDRQLSPEAVDFLKLGLHSELRRYQTEVEQLQQPSVLYDFLLNRCRAEAEKVLQMFLHVIEGLGGKLRGNMVIRKGFGEKSVYKLTHPGLFDASKEFKFFQCLLKILTKVKRDVNLTDLLRTKFSKDRFLGTNHRHIKNLPDLFIQLCQKGVITADDTHYLQKALIKHKAQECILILNDYHKSVGMLPIPWAQKIEKTQGYPCES